MSPTIAECLEHARQCEWYAARTGYEKDREFLLRKAKDWRKLGIRKELEIRAAARTWSRGLFARNAAGQACQEH
jgi:hypothetical protein